MRRRLLVALLSVLVAALVLFAIPLGAAVRGVLVDRAFDEVQGVVQQISTFVEQRARTCGEVQLWLTVAADADLDLTLFGSDGELLLAAGGGDPLAAGGEVADAAAGRTGRARRAGRLAVAVPLSTSVCRRALILRGSTADAALGRSVRNAWLAIAALGVLVLGVAAGAAMLTGRRLSSPFERLAESARVLGDGDFSARAPRSGLPEADQIADALDATADRLGRAVGRGAAFTADASHQLRTPLTALQLHLDALAAGGADPETVAAAQAEAERLAATIEELVQLTRVDAGVETVDLGEVVAERVAAWSARAEQAGRSLRLERLPTPRIRVRAAAVGQALQVLLDNTLEHGRGAVTVRVAPTVPGASAEGPGTAGVRVCVTDEGPGIDPDRVLPPTGRDRGIVTAGGGHGRGLPLARSLVEGEGGRLVLENTGGGTRACLVLPVPGDGASSPSGGRPGMLAGGRPTDGA